MFLVKKLLCITLLACCSLFAEEDYVIGGEDAPPGEYPWMVALVYSSEDDNFYAQFCGGVLVHPYYVLTATHCTRDEGVRGVPFDVSPSEIEVLIGTTSLLAGGHRVGVAEIIRHPDFDDDLLDNDIALLRLSEPVTDIEPIGIADEEAWQMAGITGRVLGWGQQSASSMDYASVLQEADLPLLSFEEANAAWDFSLIPSMLGAGDLSGVPDACGGDSGGPLLVRRPMDDAWVVAGVTSFGPACGAGGRPGVYSRVFSFREFIYENIYPSFALYAASRDEWALLGDADQNGLPLVLDYAYNLNGNRSLGEAGLAMSTFSASGLIYPQISYQRRAIGADFQMQLEQAYALDGDWTPVVFTPSNSSITNLGNGMQAVKFNASSRESWPTYFRLTVEPTGELLQAP